MVHLPGQGRKGIGGGNGKGRVREGRDFRGGLLIFNSDPACISVGFYLIVGYMQRNFMKKICLFWNDVFAK